MNVAVLLSGGVAAPKPSFSLRYELGGGSASLGNDAVAIRHRLPVTRHLGVEVRASSHTCPLLTLACHRFTESHMCCGGAEASEGCLCWHVHAAVLPCAGVAALLFRAVEIDGGYVLAIMLRMDRWRC